MTTHRSVALLVLVLVACGPSFEPPDMPPHNDLEGGEFFSDDVQGYIYVEAWHAGRKEVPYLCGDPETGQAVTCPQERLADKHLSCDAAGCHGDFDFGGPAEDDSRHVRGSDGPSCYTCHTREWSTRK
jgi:hypothetical protein